jgi:nicotinate-nucleotide adenylyltransferase
MMAIEAEAHCQLDEIRFVVAADPWQKSAERAITPAELRVAMTQAAIGMSHAWQVDARELRRGGPSFMTDTLNELTKEFPDATLVLIVGADAAMSITTWHDWIRLGELAEIVVVDRADLAAPSPLPSWTWTNVEMPRLDVSSSDLRDRQRTGRPIDVLCPEPVVALIELHGLYLERSQAADTDEHHRFGVADTVEVGADTTLRRSEASQARPSVSVTQ